MHPLVPDATLDARGLRCPLPLLKAKQALNALTSGQSVQILTSDPASVPDFAAYARQVGHQILESVVVNDGEFRIVLRKA